MSAIYLLADLRGRGFVLSANGDRLAYDAPAGAMTPEVLATLKANKAALLAALASEPIGSAWREDEKGKLIFSDGTAYAWTRRGGLILVKHPTRRMIAPGTIATDSGIRP